MFPRLFEIGSFGLPTYGVLVALGVLVGLWISVRNSARQGIKPENAWDFGIAVVLAGIVGSKLLYILVDWHTYAEHPGEIFSLATLQAGGVFSGGLIASFIVAAWFLRKHHMPALATCDAFSPGLAMGHAIGRLGCFAAGCCWGKETHLPWAVTFHNPQAWALTGVPLETPLHPSQLYEFATEALLFGYLMWRFGKPHEPGKIIGLYLVVSSVIRFLIEFTRFHEQALPFGLPLSITQWIAIGVALAGGLLLLRPTGAARISKPVPA